MTNLTEKITALKDAVAEFDAQYTKYTVENVNSAGSRARKSLMIAKKSINQIRKAILIDQKAVKAERKAAKAATKDAASADGVLKNGKIGKKGKAVATTETPK